PVTRINVGLVLPFGPTLHLCGARESKIRRARDGGTHRGIHPMMVFTSANRQRGIAPLFGSFLHCGSRIPRERVPGKSQIGNERVCVMLHTRGISLMDIAPGLI